jgi:hypothetical protein
MADNKPNAADEAATASPAGNENAGNVPDTDEAVGASHPQSEQVDAPEESEAVQRRLRRQSEKIKKMAEERDYWRGVAARRAQSDANQVAQPRQQPMTNTPGYSQDEVDRAFDTLKDRGMVTREELNEIMLRVQWDRQHDNNADLVKSQGLPEYDRDEVEEYARERGISDPMAAYRDMYFDEILDAARKTKGGSRTQQVTTERPSKPSTSAREPLSLDSFREKLAGDEGRKYYDELISDPKKFDALLAELSEG